MNDKPLSEEQRLEMYASEVRRLSQAALLGARSGWKQDSADWAVCNAEVQRRLSAAANWRAWVSMGISILSLVVAVVALLRR
jgi:hypothetical protein